MISFSSNFTFDFDAVACPFALAREGNAALPLGLLSLALIVLLALLTAAVGFLSLDLELPWIEEFSWPSAFSFLSSCGRS